MSDKRVKKFLISEFKNKKLAIMGFFILGVIASFLEAIGIGLVFPFIYVLVKPEAVYQMKSVAWLMKTLNLTDAKQFNIFLLVTIAAIIFIKMAYMIYFQLLQGKTLAKWKADLSARLMRMYLYSPYELHMKKTTTEIISTVVLGPLIYDQFIMPIFTASIATLICAGIIGILLFVLPLEAIFSGFVIAIATIFLHNVLKNKFVKIGEASNQIYKQNQKVLVQSLGAIRDTKLYGREHFFLEMYRKVQHDKFTNERTYNRLSVLPVQIIEAWIMSAIMCIVLFLLYKNAHAKALATLTILIACMFRMLPQVNKILTALRLINQTKKTLNTVSQEVDILEEDIYVPSKETRQARLHFDRSICFHDVSYAYPKSETKAEALKHVSITISKNEFIGIVGPSGAGKTTFLNLLLGLVEPGNGKVLVDGTSLQQKEHKRKWQNNIGYVPQSFYLIEDSILNNIAYGLEAKDIDMNRVDSAIEWAQLKEFISTLENGVHNKVGETGSKLSGGQRQRIGIARALYHNPDILVFDEVTKGLDIQLENEIINEIEQLRGKKTIIMIAHQLNTIRHCDRIFVFDQGMMIDSGTFDELKERCSLFAHMFKLFNAQIIPDKVTPNLAVV